MVYLRRHSMAGGGCNMCHIGLLQESQVVGVRKCKVRNSCCTYVGTPWREVDVTCATLACYRNHR